MEGSNYVGLVAVMAASGSVVLVALQAHKRLMSDFRKKFEELEIGGGGGGIAAGVGRAGSSGGERSRRHGSCGGQKKKVRFAEDVVEPSSDNKEYRRRHSVAMAGRTTRSVMDAATTPLASSGVVS